MRGVELKGDPMVLPNGAHLYFPRYQRPTAQSYHGNIYMDEYFWIHGFLEFRKVASGMAMHKSGARPTSPPRPASPSRLCVLVRCQLQSRQAQGRSGRD